MELKILKELQEHIWKLKKEEFEQLESNILKEGIRDKLIVWNDIIVDGHNRYEIAKKHGLTFGIQEMEFNEIEEVKDWMDANQLGRRNLTEDQWQISIGRRYNREKDKRGGDRGNQYVAKDKICTLPTSTKLATEYKIHPNTVKNYAKKAIEYEELKEKKPEVAKAIETGEKSFKEIKKEEKKTEIALQRKVVAERAKEIEINTNLIDFRHGDLENVFDDIEDNSIDLILTDPPYPREFIDCWSKLANLAERVLKPNKFLIAYSGQLNLPEVIKRLSEKLTYYWTFSLIHTGSRQLVMGRNVFCGWKPILVFQKGFSKIDIPIDDFIIGGGMEKSHHEWQQSQSELDKIITDFTNPGETILEPFAGSGTTIIATVKNKRKSIASEIDTNTYNIAKSRIKDELF